MREKPHELGPISHTWFASMFLQWLQIVSGHMSQMIISFILLIKLQVVNGSAILMYPHEQQVLKLSWLVTYVKIKGRGNDLMLQITACMLQIKWNRPWDSDWQRVGSDIWPSVGIHVYLSKSLMVFLLVCCSFFCRFFKLTRQPLTSDVTTSDAMWVFLDICCTCLCFDRKWSEMTDNNTRNRLMVTT